MGLFKYFKGKGNIGIFVSELSFKTNRKMQLSMTPLTLNQLRNLGVIEEQELRLEYFFYTNTFEKAKLFADVIGQLNYQVSYGQAAGNKKLYVITGWTSKMKMSNYTVGEWASQMCDLGYKFDCEFDGWGTTPNQDEK
jgi:regulator of RNase E activity RraB